MFNVKKTVSIAGLLTFGTMTSLFAKIVYLLESTGSDGEKQKYFRKPWAMTAIMFLGMSLCLPLAYIKSQKKANHTEYESSEPLLETQPRKRTFKEELHEVLMLAIPTIFDLIATILMNIGLLSVTASVYQMMRGAEMLFAATFAVMFLQRRLNLYHLLGISCCVIGIGLVGTSSYLSGGEQAQPVSRDKILTGMVLIVLSQAVQAAQLTFEDFFMADLKIEPIKIVGFEGFFGVVFMVGLMMPLAYYMPGTEGEGIHEDSFDTWAMICNSRTLQIVLVTDMLALLFYNLTGMMVTGELGAVFRTVLETMRTLFVWLVDLILFYSPLFGGALGEEWNKFSFLQLAGFCVLVSGTIVYGRGDEESVRKQMAEAALLQTPRHPIEEDSEGYPYPPLTASYPAVPMAAVPGITAPVEVARSFRATQSIAAGSYSRSLPRSVPRYGSSMPLSVHDHLVDD